MTPVRTSGAFDLLICDCDGVIIDSEIVCDRILMDMLREAYPGRDLAPALAGSFGLQTSDILVRLAAHLDEALPPGFFERLDQAIIETLQREAAPIRGVREALEQISLPVAVASNSSRDWIELSVARAGLSAAHRRGHLQRRSGFPAEAGARCLSARGPGERRRARAMPGGGG